MGQQSIAKDGVLFAGALVRGTAGLPDSEQANGNLVRLRRLVGNGMMRVGWLVKVQGELSDVVFRTRDHADEKSKLTARDISGISSMRLLRWR